MPDLNAGHHDVRLLAVWFHGEDLQYLWKKINRHDVVLAFSYFFRPWSFVGLEQGNL